MSISQDIKELIQESYFISDDTISVDLDKFESGECNKLIISGLMGAGKTTLGKQLAKKYNCSVIDTDEIYNLLENKKYKNITNKEYIDICNNKLLKLLTNPQRQIISGVSLAFMYGIDESNINYNHKFKMLLKYSFIFLGKSALKGGIAATKRDITNSKGLNKLLNIFTTTIYIPGNFLFNHMMDKLKKDRIAIKNSVIKPFKI